jgi:hypothetical protein
MRLIGRHVRSVRQPVATPTSPAWASSLSNPEHCRWGPSCASIATNSAQAIPRRNTEAGAAALAIKLVSAEVHGPGDLDAAFQALAGERVDFVSVFPDSLFFIERRRIATLAIGVKLPTLFGFREHVEVGGLLSYGVDASESFRHHTWTGY